VGKLEVFQSSSYWRMAEKSKIIAKVLILNEMQRKMRRNFLPFFVKKMLKKWDF
jgi:hypothetical protein